MAEFKSAGWYEYEESGITLNCIIGDHSQHKKAPACFYGPGLGGRVMPDRGLDWR